MASIYDAEATAALLVPSATVTTDSTFAAIKAAPLLWPTCMCVVSVTSAPAGGSLVVLLEVSSTAGGTFTPIASQTWPPGVTAPHQLMIGASARAAGLVTPTALYARVRALVSGGSFTFSAWLTKPGGRVGSLSRAGDLISV